MFPYRFHITNAVSVICECGLHFNNAQYYTQENYDMCFDTKRILLDYAIKDKFQEVYHHCSNQYGLKTTGSLYIELPTAYISHRHLTQCPWRDMAVILIFELFLGLVSWALPAKLLSGECHDTFFLWQVNIGSGNGLVSPAIITWLWCFFPGFDRFIPGFDRFIPGFDRFIPASIPVTGTLPPTI